MKIFIVSKPIFDYLNSKPFPSFQKVQKTINTRAVSRVWDKRDMGAGRVSSSSQIGEA